MLLYLTISLVPQPLFQIYTKLHSIHLLKLFCSFVCSPEIPISKEEWRRTISQQFTHYSSLYPKIKGTVIPKLTFPAMAPTPMPIYVETSLNLENAEAKTIIWKRLKGHTNNHIGKRAEKRNNYRPDKRFILWKDQEFVIGLIQIGATKSVKVRIQTKEIEQLNLNNEQGIQFVQIRECLEEGSFHPQNNPEANYSSPAVIITNKQKAFKSN